MKGAFYISSGLVVYLIVTGLLQATAHAGATKDADRLLFGPTATVRLLLVALVLGFACASVYVSVVSPPSLAGAVIFGLISVAGTLAFPSNIIVNRIGVAEIKWWGAKTAIAWQDVNRIEYHKGPSTIVVISDSGAKVVHSGWNRDTDGFLETCEGKSGLSAMTSEM